MRIRTPNFDRAPVPGIALTRRGVALILTVVLLVLLSMLGMAYLVSAREDRAASHQDAHNTQLDLLVEGLSQLARQTVVDDLFQRGTYRDEQSYWTAPGDVKANQSGPSPDPWLASRLPQVNQLGLRADEARNRPYWRYISAPPMGDHFDSPWTPDGLPQPYATRQWVAPTQTPAIDGQSYPAFQFLDPQSGRARPGCVLAADADGDGIADAGLVKLPMGQLDGITYYYAVRIIDSNSALNASVAWEPNPRSDITEGLPGNFFPTNVDLRGLLIGPAEMDALDAWRCGGKAPSLVPSPDARPASSVSGPAPTDAFQFVSPYEALWAQLGSRLDHPGLVDRDTAYCAVPLTDSMILARRFCLSDGPCGTGILEQALPRSLDSVAAFAPYSPGDVARWFEENFAFDTSGSNQGDIARPARAILTARNPVSNFCPSKFNSRGPWAAERRYAFGDLVSFAGHLFVCVQAHTSGESNAPSDASSPFWVPQLWTSAPAKTSVNTADFGQLWLAYWSVITDSAPIDASGGLPPLGANSDGAGKRMFRSSLRGHVKLTAAQEMLLRSALAAINTLQLRSNTFDANTGFSDVISHSIWLPDGAGNPQYQVTLFGADRQPFITEIYARAAANPQNDYVAVELFNPYPQSMVLRNWTLATIGRDVPSDSGMDELTLTALDSTVEGTTSWQVAPPVIPPGGYLVLASSATPPAGTLHSPTAQLGSSTAPLRVVPDLLEVLGREMVLLRPRRGDGTLSRSLDPADSLNAFDEGTTADPHFDQCVPIDSYDFTGLLPSGMAAPADWHYIRPSDPAAGKAWHFVYPGHYGEGAPGRAVSPSLVDGTQLIEWMDATPPPVDLSTLGRADPAALNAAYHDAPVQLNATGAPGPFKPAPGVTSYFPFGTFARNGDILQVPFIGAYRVSAVASPESTPAGTFLELNPVTMDAAFADDDDPNDDVDAAGAPVENIGHFCPIDGADLPADLRQAPRADDFSPDPARWRYHWALRLFDYLTAQSPPDPWPPDRANAANPASIEGLININTASWRVLAAVPWIPAPSDPADAPQQSAWRAANAAIAQAIVAYRDGTLATDDSPMIPAHGAFRSILELNDVPVPAGSTLRLRDILGGTATTVFGPAQGKLTPYRNPTDPLPPGVPRSAFAPVLGDFSSRLLVVNNVSNLLTTRSDSFVVYVIVQGWREAGTPTPKLVSQRRAAFLVDRSAVTPANRAARMVRVPAD